MKRIVIILILLSACSNLFSKVITDIAGRKVTIKNNIKKIVTIGPGALRLVAYLKSINKVCGIEKIELNFKPSLIKPYSYLINKKIEKLPVIGEGGPGKMPYFEQLLMVNPDVIIAVGFTRGQVDFIQQKLNIPVILLDYGSLGVLNNKFIKSLEILGKTIGKKEEAKNMINYIFSITKDLSRRVKRSDNFSVYVGGIAYKGLHDITSSDTDFFPFKILHLNNVVSESPIKGHIFITWEKLIDYNPDFIFIDKTSLPIITLNFQKNLPKFKLLNAFLLHRIFIILPYNYYNTNVENVYIATYTIGKIIFPNQFKDINLLKKSKEIYSQFLGIEINKNLKKFLQYNFNID